MRFSESNIEQSQRSDISGFLTLAVMELDPTTGDYNSNKPVIIMLISNKLVFVEY